MTTCTCLTKPHKEHVELVHLLQKRGMEICDKDRAIRKLSQIGYYRLSGFWYPCRKPLTEADGVTYSKDPVTKMPIRSDLFQENVRFDDITDLYLFDKKLRQLLLNAIERVEIHIRSVIAHELGRLDPLAYKSECYINPNVMKEKKRPDGSKYTIWGDWVEKQNGMIQSSTVDCIKWHKKRGKEIPFWVVIECWDFGLMSKYFQNLKRTYQELVCKHFGLDNPKTFRSWLTELNNLRNSCAHHSRVWNLKMANAISTKGTEGIPYFQRLNLSSDARERIYAHIAVLWYLVQMIGPSSDWIGRVADLIDCKPRINSCPYTAMGFQSNKGFPRHKFAYFDGANSSCPLAFCSILNRIWLSCKKTV
ncbi:Abi family protein [Desulfosediminicola sp.]|uniref:Abi family protein n=1 Tax=Desulfosediminicola sp. TaxID=2886825 RepID=UPI003AF28D25